MSLASERIAELLDVARMSVEDDFADNALVIDSQAGVRFLIPVEDLHNITDDQFLVLKSLIRQLASPY